jgi:hypothetical protein
VKKTPREQHDTTGNRRPSRKIRPQRYLDIHHQLKTIHKHNPHLGHLSRSTKMHELDPEDMPMLFKSLAKKLRKFMERLNEFPEFNGMVFI